MPPHFRLMHSLNAYRFALYTILRYMFARFHYLVVGTMSTDQPSQPPDATSLIFEKFKDYFDQRFKDLPRSSQESTSGIKQLQNKLEAKELARPGNSAQFEFCGNLEIILDKARTALTENSDAESALQALDEAHDLIKERKRKIRIADGSKAGWATNAHLDKKGNEKLGVSAEELKGIKIAEEEALKEQHDRKRKRQDGPDPVPKDPSDRRLFRGTDILLCFLHNSSLCM